MSQFVNPEQTDPVPRRAVLTEISLMPDRGPDPQDLESFREVRFSGNSMPVSMLTPSSSPDEIVIQRRGRRNIPIIFSPDIDIIKQNNDESSTELGSSSLNKSSVVLRSTPRKRLIYDLSDTSSPEEYYSGPSTAKKLRSEPTVQLPDDICFLTAMKSLSSDQLISIIGQIVDDHPDIEKEVRSYFPLADLKPLEERITSFRQSIYKGLPTSRLASKTDPTAYNNVAMHVLDFKKCVIDQGRRLVESKQWPVVMNYVFMAWNQVRCTPIWDNPSHNASRRQCFKSLSAICVIALKNMKDMLDEQLTEYYQTELTIMSSDSNEDIALCLEHLNPK